MNKRTFKDIVNDDLDVFLNAEEFGDEHTYEDVTTTIIVVDNNTEDIKNIQRAAEVASDAVFISTKTIYLKSSLVERPSDQQRVQFDNEIYYVQTSSIDEGMLRIVLIAHVV